jgi:hypothetical protein
MMAHGHKDEKAFKRKSFFYVFSLISYVGYLSREADDYCSVPSLSSKNKAYMRKENRSCQIPQIGFQWFSKLAS